jgi:hypothetical protein
MMPEHGIDGIVLGLMLRAETGMFSCQPGGLDGAGQHQQQDYHCCNNNRCQ